MEQCKESFSQQLLSGLLPINTKSHESRNLGGRPGHAAQLGNPSQAQADGGGGWKANLLAHPQGL